MYQRSPGAGFGARWGTSADEMQGPEASTTLLRGAMIEGMEPRTTGIAALYVALFALGCSSTVASGGAAGGAQAASAPREIVRLHTRDGDVGLLVGHAGQRVALYGAGGALERTTDVDALRATDPALYELLTTATAHSDTLDATLDGPRRAPPAAGLPVAPQR
jgi:hypothetical protein